MLLVLFFAFLYELIDSSLGQGYGTLGTPTFILLGLDPKAVVPAILLSQAAGGLISGFFHNRFRNVDFNSWRTGDAIRVYFIVACGVAGVVAASAIGIRVSRTFLSYYIGAVALAMGALLLSGVALKFSWWRMGVIGGVSAFNKGISGGGYGPLVAGGQAIIGVEGKAAVGVTDLAEAPICLAGFAVWKLLGGTPVWEITLPMCLGAAAAPVLGAYITLRTPARLFKSALGVALICLGALCLLKVLNH
ncbi:MAG: sulfite exporter TauE/SafE family protein [Thermoplasmatota archaeon]